MELVLEQPENESTDVLAPTTKPHAHVAKSQVGSGDEAGPQSRRGSPLSLGLSTIDRGGILVVEATSDSICPVTQLHSPPTPDWSQGLRCLERGFQMNAARVYKKEEEDPLLKAQDGGAIACQKATEYKAICYGLLKYLRRGAKNESLLAGLDDFRHR
ncbi:hypothetical protein Tco_0155671 [Tanacetum coccineum]